MSQYRSPLFDLGPGVKNLIIINLLIWLFDITNYNKHLIGIDLHEMFGLHYWELDSFNPFQMITYMFLHDRSGIMHVFFNMFNLWMFGAAMENFWGTRRFIIYYLACGIGAGLLYAMIPGLHVTVGASAAVYGLLLAFGMTFPNEYIYLYFLMPIKTKWFIGGMIAIELIQGIFYSYDGIAHFAHLGGMLIGFLLILWWRKHPFSRI